ncbi:hypothetical protein [Nonomuraea recticatena]|uniref:Uncharacterized protein n=1 Tax=Nonomuraea recticatena TaxID=46178 RepID=A0ABN3S858_9ACTN
MAEIYGEGGFPDDESGPASYDHHEVETELWGGSVRTVLRLVVTDAEELRRACDSWLHNKDLLDGPLTLTSYSRGEEIGPVTLSNGSAEAIDWETVGI